MTLTNQQIEARIKDVEAALDSNLHRVSDGMVRNLIHVIRELQNSRADIEALARLERENEVLKQQLSGITGELEALKAERDEIGALLGIGEKARTPAVIETNIRNLKDFSEKLHALFRLDALRVPVEDECEETEPFVSVWGTDVNGFVNAFETWLQQFAIEQKISGIIEAAYHVANHDVGYAVKGKANRDALVSFAEQLRKNAGGSND